MRLVFETLGIAVFFFVTMLLIGIVAYHIGDSGNLSFTVNGIGGDSFGRIVQNALMAGVLVSLWRAILKRRGYIQA